MDMFFGDLSSNFQSTPNPKNSSVAQEHSEGPNESTTGEGISFANLDDSYERHTGDDSGISGSGGDADRENRGKELTHFSDLSLRVNEMGRRAQGLVENINQSWAKDQEILNNFHEELTKKVSQVCLQVREVMFRCYAANGCLMESSLLELSEALARSTQVITELQSTSHILATITKGLCETSQH